MSQMELKKRVKSRKLRIPGSCIKKIEINLDKNIVKYVDHDEAYWINITSNSKTTDFCMYVSMSDLGRFHDVHFIPNMFTFCDSENMITYVIPSWEETKDDGSIKVYQNIPVKIHLIEKSYNDLKDYFNNHYRKNII